VVRFSDQLSSADAAVLETFVVPRYLSLFGELALEMLLAGPTGRIVHLGCRTGYPNHELLDRFDEVTIVAVDGSPEALDLAQSMAAGTGDVPIHYGLAEQLPLDIDEAQYSHVLTLHPLAREEDRAELFREARRLLCPGGQLLAALPLRGSFQELGDLLKEYALKHGHDDFGDRVERMMIRRPTIEILAEQLEAAALVDVDVEIRKTRLLFDSGRAFVDDPITRLLVVPDLATELEVDDLAEPIGYLRDAIDRYWSEHQFDLTLNVGCASARRA
jgi:SAM-dependent methyltransferase